jgi:hypothetical protein
MWNFFMGPVSPAERLLNKWFPARIYRIKLKDRISPDRWTFPEACQLMRVVAGCEILLDDGQIHYSDRKS